MTLQSSAASQSMQTRHTITTMFDRRDDATTAVEDLVRAGIPRTDVKITPVDDMASGSAGTSYETTRDDKGFWSSLGDMFMPDEDRVIHAEALHRGHIMVAVTADQAHASIAEDILEQHGTVDLEAQEASWRQSGWTAPVPTAATSSALGVASTTKTSTSGATATKAVDAAVSPHDETISLYEEKLNVGKRQVNAGRVKIRTYTVETPVNEQVSLRSESVHVDRRPVDRAVVAGEDMFQDRTIEAEERSEEAVIQKDVRVKEEIGLHRVAEDQVKTISDKVRHTEIEVEDERVDAKRIDAETRLLDTPKR